MTDTYKLTARDMPGRRTHSIYADILREFVENKKRRNLLDLAGKVKFREGYNYKKLREGR